MARGWESKSVEDQVQDFQSKQTENHNKRMTPAQVETYRRREVLLLSRARVQTDLEACRDPRYRAQLARALADLDAQLSELQDPL